MPTASAGAERPPCGACGRSRSRERGGAVSQRAVQTPAGPAWRWSPRRTGGQGRRAPARSRSSACGGVSPLPGSAAAGLRLVGAHAGNPSGRRSPSPCSARRAAKSRNRYRIEKPKSCCAARIAGSPSRSRNTWRASASMPSPPSDRDDRVGKPAEARRDRDQPERREQQRVEQDLPPRRIRAGDVRQHRDAGARVVAGFHERERPEMRRRPQEDDGEEDEASQATPCPRPPPAPIIGGKAPAAPPMTMFCGVQRFSHIE